VLYDFDANLANFFRLTISLFYLGPTSCCCCCCCYKCSLCEERSLGRFVVHAFPLKSLRPNTSFIIAPVEEIFETQPIHFGSEDDVYLPIIHELTRLQKEKGFQLAKQILDMSAEFICIRDNHYVYKFSPHSLFIALKKGVTPQAITRTLNELSKNHMPTRTFMLIMNVDEYKNYYKAVVVLKGGKYHVQSDSMDLLSDLLQNVQIRELVSKPDQLDKTVQTSAFVVLKLILLETLT